MRVDRHGLIRVAKSDICDNVLIISDLLETALGYDPHSLSNDVTFEASEQVYRLDLNDMVTDQSLVITVNLQRVETLININDIDKGLRSFKTDDIVAEYCQSQV